MALLGQLGGVLERYAGGSAPSVSREQAHNDYDRIASQVPADTLKSIIGPAIASLGGGQIEERISNAASEMTPPQRGQFLNVLLNAAGQSGANIGSLLTRLGVNPAVAASPNTASPAEVGKVAAHVQQAHPDAFHKAMAFFSEHPELVKVLGTLAIAKIAQQLSTRTPQPSR